MLLWIKCEHGELKLTLTYFLTSYWAWTMQGWTTNTMGTSMPECTWCTGFSVVIFHIIHHSSSKTRNEHKVEWAYDTIHKPCIFLCCRMLDVNRRCFCMSSFHILCSTCYNKWEMNTEILDPCLSMWKNEEEENWLINWLIDWLIFNWLIEVQTYMLKWRSKSDLHTFAFSSHCALHQQCRSWHKHWNVRPTPQQLMDVKKEEA